jgi:hypothetical protein
MSTLRVTNVQDTAGANSLTTAQIYNGASKAWVNFNGTGLLRFVLTLMSAVLRITELVTIR